MVDNTKNSRVILGACIALVFDYYLALKLKVGIVRAKLNQMSKENKMLTEMVSIMQANYTALRSQFFNLATASNSKEGAISPSQKRRSRISGNPNEDCSFKRLREDPPRPKISTVYVQTDPSDSSLVGSKANLMNSVLSRTCCSLLN